VNGVLQITGQGAFLRSSDKDFMPSSKDVYVPRSLIEKFNLRYGHFVEGRAFVIDEKNNKKRMVAVDRIQGRGFDEMREVFPFEDLTSIDPDQRLVLETTPKQLSMRLVDIVSPIGRGQRGLIVAPPKTGKTILLQQIAESLITNHPDIHLMILLVDERPEEVTDFKRFLKDKKDRVELIASSNDRPVKNHTRIAEITLERAKRKVEFGEDVVILLDSITRLARAHNQVSGDQGKTLTGGVGANALQQPKKFFGAARNLEEGGSLTIIATALVDTGSRMDEVIFQEFKGTGNLELVLDRRVAEKRIWPALNINQSGTRKDQLLLDEKTWESLNKLRGKIAGYPSDAAMEDLITSLKRTKSNAEFVSTLERRLLV
jgi:transcription termination factor Rho